VSSQKRFLFTSESDSHRRAARFHMLKIFQSRPHEMRPITAPVGRLKRDLRPLGLRSRPHKSTHLSLVTSISASPPRQRWPALPRTAAHKQQRDSTSPTISPRSLRFSTTAITRLARCLTGRSRRRSVIPCQLPASMPWGSISFQGHFVLLSLMYVPQLTPPEAEETREWRRRLTSSRPGFRSIRR
jgi:hypothetical protein